MINFINFPKRRFYHIWGRSIWGRLTLMFRLCAWSISNTFWGNVLDVSYASWRNFFGRLFVSQAICLPITYWPLTSPYFKKGWLSDNQQIPSQLCNTCIVEIWIKHTSARIVANYVAESNLATGDARESMQACWWYDILKKSLRPRGTKSNRSLCGAFPFVSCGVGISCNM